MPDNGVVKLVPASDPEKIARAKGFVIDCLEIVLEKARKGEFTGIAIAAVCDDGNREGVSTYTNSAGMNKAGIIAAVARLQYRVVSED